MPHLFSTANLSRGRITLIGQLSWSILSELKVHTQIQLDAEKFILNFR